MPYMDGMGTFPSYFLKHMCSGVPSLFKSPKFVGRFQWHHNPQKGMSYCLTNGDSLRFIDEHQKPNYIIHQQ